MNMLDDLMRRILEILPDAEFHEEPRTGEVIILSGFRVYEDGETLVPVVYPIPSVTDEEKCEEFKRLDREYNTGPDSPLHHDNRCPIHS